MMETNIKDIKKIAVIMAGGFGDRLWPRSKNDLPEQFNHFIGFGTMIQNTIARLIQMFDYENIYVVTNHSLLNVVKAQLPLLPEENIILEPFGKQTAPCLGLAATVLSDKYSDDTVMLAFPSDHFIGNVREYIQSLELACKVAYERKGIVTIGITPTRAEKGFGYIQIKEEDNEGLGEYFDKGVRYSSAFAEKPDVETARRFIESGDFLWNSGIFVWRLDTLWDAFKEFLPEHTRLFGLMQNKIGNEFIEEIYRQMEAESIDYAILEKAANVYVVKSTFSWSDLGNWDEVFRLKIKDARNNFIEGKVVPIDVKNCLISSCEKIIGIVGVEGLIVIEDENSIVICKRDDSDRVKELVDFMKRKQITPYL